MSSRRFACCLVPLCALLMSLCACGPRGEQGPEEQENSKAEPAFVVLSTQPADGAAGVSRSAAITFVLSQPVDTASISTDSITLNPAVMGQVEVAGDGTSVVFMPAGLMAQNTSYKATLSGITSASGGALKESSLRFSTGFGEPLGETGVYKAGEDRVTVSVTGEPGARGFTMTTTAALRDNDPASKSVAFTEQPGKPFIQTGHDIFDALFALSIEEARQNSVSAISDGAFNNGQGVPCECFETGAKWNYVWTRDTAYAVDLGLAVLDPQRARRSLEFKLSERKQGGDLQIVQDTGSGGSWPVSTDRVVWAIGAWELLKYLSGEEREAFRARTLEALKNTIAQDRVAVFDESLGLYRGEQSFLDWREQSYPSWTREDTVHLAMSHALSTNVGHHAILWVAAELAREVGEQGEAARYDQMARDLAAAINASLWLEDAGMYSALMTTTLDPAPLHKFDLLGESLAVLQGVAPGARAERVVKSYPHVPMGPAVLWPQQPLIPVYHNRGIWPFVTAYGLLAARKVENARVVEHDLESLIRGAALNLSNMENFEFTTLQPYYEDGEYSGPVVNSRRQLWSVAGYFGAIVKGIWGMEATQSGVKFAPFITPAMHARWFAQAPSGRVKLGGVRWREHAFEVVVQLPESPGAMDAGAYAITSVLLNGQQTQGHWETGELEAMNTVEITLGAASSGATSGITLVEDVENFRALWAPREPNLTALERVDQGVRLSFDSNGEQDVVFDIWRDGERVASGVQQGKWVDASPPSQRAPCYAVEAVFAQTNNRSHHSRALCDWGEGDARVRELEAHALKPGTGGDWSTMHGRAHYQDWGEPEDTLVLASVRPSYTGLHHLQLVYGNGAGGLTTGITAAVKQVVVERAATGEEVAREWVVMPHLADWSRWGESSLASVSLQADEIYRVRIEDGMNMSYFEHFSPYTGGLGGGEGVYNRANVHAVRLLARGGERAGRTHGTLMLDGVEDLGKYAAVFEPGAPMQPWSRYGVSWDDEALYVSLASQAIEEAYAPVMIYMQVGELGVARPSKGLRYSGLEAELPFEADVLIAVRRTSQGEGEGPWNAIWRKGESGWELQQRLVPGEQWWVSADAHTLSVRVPMGALGAPARARMVAHVVYAEQDNEWKETLPAQHQPWQEGGGSYYEVSLSGAVPMMPWTSSP